VSVHNPERTSCSRSDELFSNVRCVKQGTMNTDTQHPVIAAFENLLRLRDFAHSNPQDVGASFVMFCSANVAHSRSQVFQDLFVVFVLKGKRNGFFVEFGATDGLNLSNTVILERDRQWRGILAEPAICWHAALKRNRSAMIDHRCVWSQTGAKACIQGN
jgi:hypothetical protein